MRVSKIMNNGRRKWFYTLWSWQCAGCCAFFWYAWVLKYEMIILCPHSLMFPLCFNVSVFRPCACVILWPSSSILLSLYWLIPVAIGCLLCVWVIYCGDNIFYIKKEYCGLLGGLTFYRTRHICKSDKVKKKKKKNTSLFLHRACTKQIPFCGLCTLFLQLHNFLVHASGRPSLLGWTSGGGLS